ncbi:MAG: type II toxin-antitoxin system VapC family toxin [Acidimicrobiales bacterium]
MIVDSSAIVAVLLREPGFEAVLERLAPPASAGIGAPTLAETGLVLTTRLGHPATSLLARFIDEASIAVIAFGPQHWSMAVGAFLRFGKGRHPAALNFGDCLTYAVARMANQPLLCLGNDFARTDLDLVQ